MIKNTNYKKRKTDVERADDDDENMGASVVCGMNEEVNCDENVKCCECGLEEVAKEKCINGSLMNWVGCTMCERWCHEVCLRTVSEDFVCKFCL
jgi:hypothetical protein